MPDLTPSSSAIDADDFATADELSSRAQQRSMGIKLVWTAR
jgi:hypothetical protein